MVIRRYLHVSLHFLELGTKETCSTLPQLIVFHAKGRDHPRTWYDASIKCAAYHVGTYCGVKSVIGGSGLGQSHMLEMAKQNSQLVEIEKYQ